MEFFKNVSENDKKMAEDALLAQVEKMPDIIGKLYKDLEYLESSLNDPDLEYRLREVEDMQKEEAKNTIIDQAGDETIQSYKVFDISKIVELLNQDIANLREEYQIIKADSRSGLMVMTKATALDQTMKQVVGLINIIKELETVRNRSDLVKETIALMKDEVEKLKVILKPIKDQNYTSN